MCPHRPRAGPRDHGNEGAKRDHSGKSNAAQQIASSANPACDEAGQQCKSKAVANSHRHETCRGWRMRIYFGEVEQEHGRGGKDYIPEDDRANGA